MSGPTELPGDPGTYGLILLLARSTRIVVGALGVFDFAPGHYVYVGSAFGPGGLKARLGRHIAGNGRRHWHIDYLRRAASVEAVCFSTADDPLEHAWARALGNAPGAGLPAPRFGASDCGCASHLIALPDSPTREFLTRILAAPGEDTVRTLTVGRSGPGVVA